MKTSKKQGWVIKHRLQAGWSRVRRAKKLTTVRRCWAKVYYAGVGPATSFGTAVWGASDKHIRQQRAWALQSLGAANKFASTAMQWAMSASLKIHWPNSTGCQWSPMRERYG